MTSRTCLLHVGTHKTGTTSLQLFFENNKEQLRSAGVYLPQAGRYGSLPGNHYIAWDMLAEAKSRHFDELLADLSNVDCRTALLTSEDFSLLHARSEALSAMAEGLRAAGYRPVIVLYLRPQAAFAESMYVERIKHKYVRKLDTYLNTILSTGAYIPDGTAIHLQFEYTRLLEPFVTAFGKENIVVRAYEAQRGVAHIFQDFMTVFGSIDPSFANTPLNLQVHAPRANDSLNFIQLLYTAYASVHDGTAQPAEQAVPAIVSQIREIAPQLSNEMLLTRYALMTREETLAFVHRFGPDNDAIAQQYGVTVPFRTEADVAPASDPVWSRAAIERHLFDRLLERWMTAGA
jgi:hypothetical protein